LNIPETIDPGAGMSNLKERAAKMTQAPHQMSPDAEAASQLDTTTVRASQVSDLPSLTKQQLLNEDDAASEPPDPKLKVQ
jgi:hypothetical protein